jgi:hypothetical protein
MASKIKGRIWDAYVACERLCESDRDADAWLRRSFDEARKSEKQHRDAGKRFTDGLAKYKLPVADAARFFAVKWFLDSRISTPSFADACSLRPDSLYALGARDRVRSDKVKEEKWLRLYSEFSDVANLDYSEVFAA